MNNNISTSPKQEELKKTNQRAKNFSFIRQVL